MTNYYLSFDVEDWFHSHNLRPGLDWDAWDSYELRVVDTTHRLLDMLDEHDVRATFFVLGYVAERAPALVTEIGERGHEVASHGYGHELLYEQPDAAVRDDIRRSVNLLSSAVDQSIDGYRAPSFSITDHALSALADFGFRYDSSRFAAPVHDRYGSIEVVGDGTVTKTNNGLAEIQLPLLDVGVTQIPWAGGGYFRFVPYPVYRRGVEHIARHRDFVFYLHPWELDPDQPRVTGIPLQYRVRHYTNLHRTADRLDKLLADFDWQPIGSAL